MRSHLELWLIVEENFDNYFCTGICRVLARLLDDDEITVQEYNFLMNTLYRYGLKRWRLDKFYLWTAGDKKPRKMFIQKQILKEIRKPLF